MRFKITLNNKLSIEYDRAITVPEVIRDISNKFNIDVIACKIDNKYIDSTYIVDGDCHISTIVSDSIEGLNIIRHSSAHLMAHAVKVLYPLVNIYIGPTINNGFYYDFDSNVTFSHNDIKRIELKMLEIVKLDYSIVRKVLERSEAIDYFKLINETYKIDIINKISIGEEITTYRQGNFVDLCKGPHVLSTGALKAFKLTKVSGVYFKGDSNNKMLQRIYGIAFESNAALNRYIHIIEEKKKRDHRVLGKKYDLFHIQDDTPGMIFWHSNGAIIYNEIVNYVRSKVLNNGYMEVITPQVVSKGLWIKSGHWDKFEDNIFTVHSEKNKHLDYIIKPMNCPCHIQIFNQKIVSYKELPVRIFEFGVCHRYEVSGSLYGLMRARSFTIDDGHIFCSDDQIEDEIQKFISLLYAVYSTFGFLNITVKLATRPKCIDSDNIFWSKSEAALINALNKSGVLYEINDGEGAFYGPKAEFSLKDSLGRVWQCGTIQVDFITPHKLNAKYIDKVGMRRVPILLHRAILGSIERFIGVLIEEKGGLFPTWLSPVQVVLLTITEFQVEYANEIYDVLIQNKIRVTSDLRNKKIGLKIREYSIKRIPYLLVLGRNECFKKTVFVRGCGGNIIGEMSIGGFISKIKYDILNKGES